MRKTTLRSRLILGFGAVIVPLLVLLMYNNWYAMQVVRYQVAGSNQNLVRMSMDQVDSVLEETDKYLSKTALQDPDLTSLSSYPSDSPEAFFAKVNTLNQLSGDIAYYSEIEAFFAYGTQAKELLLAPQEKLGYDKKEQFKARLEQMLDDSGVRSLLVKKWTLLETDGEYSLLRVVDTQYGSYVGAWVDLGKLLKPLDSMEFGDNSQVLFASPNGRILTQGSGEPLAGIVSPPDLQKALTDSGQPYNILRGEAAGSDSMVVSRPSHAADIYLAVLQPERSLLEKLPAFQRLIYATSARFSRAGRVSVLPPALDYASRAQADPRHAEAPGGRACGEAGAVEARRVYGHQRYVQRYGPADQAFEDRYLRRTDPDAESGAEASSGADSSAFFYELPQFDF